MSGRNEMRPANPGVKLTYDDFVRFPDDGMRLLFVSSARQHEVLTAKHVRGAPDLVVEIGSTATRTRDETIKRRLYERFGVSEYWVINPERDSVHVYRRIGKGYARVAELRLEQHDVLTTPLLPGLDLPLERIFED